jgi:hypothetical protein
LATLTHLGILRPHTKGAHRGLHTKLIQGRHGFSLHLLADIVSHVSRSFFGYNKYPTFRTPDNGGTLWAFLHFLEELAPHLLHVNDDAETLWTVQPLCRSPEIGAQLYKAKAARSARTVTDICAAILAYLTRTVPELPAKHTLALIGFPSFTLERKGEVLAEINYAYWDQLCEDDKVVGLVILLKQIVDKQIHKVQANVAVLEQTAGLKTYEKGTAAGILAKMMARTASGETMPTSTATSAITSGEPKP